MNQDGRLFQALQSAPAMCHTRCPDGGASRGLRATGTPPPQYIPAMEEKGAINFKEGVILSTKHKSTVYRQTPPPPYFQVRMARKRGGGEGGKM